MLWMIWIADLVESVNQVVLMVVRKRNVDPEG